MIRYKYSKGPIETKVISIAILALVWLILLLMMSYPAFIERFYSRGLYVAIYHVMHPVFNVFPFSVGDVFYIGLILYGLYALVLLLILLFKRRFRSVLIYMLKLVIGLQTLVLLFYLLWGLNYFRPSAAKRLALQDTSYTYQDIKAVTAILIDSANATRAKLSAGDLKDDNKLIYETAEKAIDTLSLTSAGFPAYHPKVKASLLTYFMNYLGTEGDYNPFTSEAQMNSQMPVFLRPFTACHEMGHQMGFGAEDEANFVGFIAGVQSKDKLLRYSAYYNGMEEFLFTVYRKDSLDFKQLRTRISAPVMHDRKTDRLYWKGFESRAGIFGSILYDRYLKTNNQPQGLKTYNRMIRLVMAWYRKSVNKKKTGI